MSRFAPTPPGAVPDRRADVVVVGGGAAGLFAALAARLALEPSGALVAPPAGAPRVVVLTNEPRLGLKLLVSGGGRCNVTNERVVETDYSTGAPHVLRGLLKGFPPASVRAFFEGRGVRLYAEPLGKLFPTSDDAHDVLGALLDACREVEVPVVAPAEATEVVEQEGGWRVELQDGGAWTGRAVVVATGGRSLPKTGSRGFGLELLRRLGHALEPSLPALTPLRLAPDGPLAGLAGLTVPALLTLAPRGAQPEQVAGARFRPLARAAGSLLVTHKGASGPAALDVSGACGLALSRGEDVVLLGDLWTLLADERGPWAPFRDAPKAPGASLPPDLAPRPPAREPFLAWLDARDRERALVNALAPPLPRTLAQALVTAAGLDPGAPLKRLDARQRARLHLALTQADLKVTGTDGYDKAEVTGGGVLLSELDRATLESRRRPGLFACGEVVDVTGRLGGFNFQWAWSSGFAAGRGAARRLRA